MFYLAGWGGVGTGGKATGMDWRYRTPAELVEALQQRDREARAWCWDLLRQPLERLFEEWIARHGLEQQRELLTVHTLHLVETWLRTRSHESFAGMSWSAFRAAAVLHVAKLAFQPFGDANEQPRGPNPLPESPLYHSEIYFRPYEQLGRWSFGGDWYAGHQTEDGAYWVLVADVTGHGYHAYLLACALPGVWQQCWSASSEPDTQPAHLLQRMHDLLEDCLPEGVFLECTLVRLGPDGTVTVGPAGATRLLLRRGDAPRPDFHRLRGTWLGLQAPEFADQQSWVLEQGDELLLATDGIFDQLDEVGEEDPFATPGSLFEGVRACLDRALALAPQKDDMTMVLLRRRSGNCSPSAGQERV
jgi:hypothetical protein